MAEYSFFLLSLSLLLLHLYSAIADSGCPLDITGSNVTRAAIICSDTESKASCCHHNGFCNDCIAKNSEFSECSSP